MTTKKLSEPQTLVLMKMDAAKKPLDYHDICRFTNGSGMARMVTAGLVSVALEAFGTKLWSITDKGRAALATGTFEAI